MNTKTLFTTVIAVASTFISTAVFAGFPPGPPISTDITITDFATNLYWNFQTSPSGACSSSPNSGKVYLGSTNLNIATVTCPFTANGQINLIANGNSVGTVFIGYSPCKVLSQAPGYKITATPGDACKIGISENTVH